MSNENLMADVTLWDKIESSTEGWVDLKEFILKLKETPKRVQISTIVAALVNNPSDLIELHAD